jgi:hypothetical protein
MTLDCSTGDETIGMVTLLMPTECYAENTAILTGVAWCTHVYRQYSQPPAQLLKYWWDMQVAG